ncbi:pimeloyl-ACP methyl ester carboxylesterase [Stackebrandtia albiflava]|uniref:Pimeloyl-ACP methyl ester carboxylesterase n=1 Tax=Stackebrandtia albiflava TaxID=406432 RepID=A0A562VDU7_9ACTN|nr:alpha/beta hydrolase [Stackebrandtia albiflava]TWJ16050.1 pimeloyl-ACP methyl ester carboxylesterase [Stackebrandtia albiflava]
MTERRTHTLEVPGAVLHYDVREARSGDRPALLAIGSPMGAAGFDILAGHFTDRTVITYDPRGSERSVRTDGAERTTPQEHADDLRRILDVVGLAPVDVFASSGGAVNALVLVESGATERLRTVVAHEPPAADVLPDRTEALAASQAIHDIYLKDGMGAGMAKFIELISLRGPVPADYAARPAPDPATFGLPTEDDGSRDDALLGQNMVSSTHHRYDFEALKTAPVRLVLAAGADSEGELAYRGAVAIAERLGVAPVIFPDGHGGFLGGEYGQTGKPDEFAAKLREVLDEG